MSWMHPVIREFALARPHPLSSSFSTMKTRPWSFDNRPLQRAFLSVSLAAVTAFGGSAGAQTPITDPDEITELFAQWMVGTPVPTARAYIRTTRSIQQTGPKTAQFISGSAQFVVADGQIALVWNQASPDGVDSDQDGWRDVIEDGYQDEVGPTPDNTRWAEDPLYNPPIGEYPPDVFWTPLANGIRVPVALDGSQAATFIRPFSAPNVRLYASPPTALNLPVQLWDYSTQFYVVDPNAGTYSLTGLSFYYWSKDYVGANAGGQMEQEIVPGAYTFQFPTVLNPYQTAGVSVIHNLVPNGTLNIGMRRPNWLVRKAVSLERLDQAPVEQRWRGGRLVFDPALPTTITWDNLVSAGLASTGEQISVAIQADDGDGNIVQIWPPIGGGLIVPAFYQDVTIYGGNLYGVPGLDNPTSPLSREAELVLRYTRGGSNLATGDISSVVLRVPVLLEQSYASWRQLFFAGNNIYNDAVSGPNADPDRDGLTNQEEFDLGLDPTVPSLGPLVVGFVAPATPPGAKALTTGVGLPQVRYEKQQTNSTTVAYSMETSADGSEWGPIDTDLWTVDETVTDLTATYSGVEAPPERMLFRVRLTEIE